MIIKIILLTILMNIMLLNLLYGNILYKSLVCGFIFGLPFFVALLYFSTYVAKNDHTHYYLITWICFIIKYLLLSWLNFKNILIFNTELLTLWRQLLCVSKALLILGFFLIALNILIRISLGRVLVYRTFIGLIAIPLLVYITCPNWVGWGIFSYSITYLVVLTLLLINHITFWYSSKTTFWPFHKKHTLAFIVVYYVVKNLYTARVVHCDSILGYYNLELFAEHVYVYLIIFIKLFIIIYINHNYFNFLHFNPYFRKLKKRYLPFSWSHNFNVVHYYQIFVFSSFFIVFIIPTNFYPILINFFKTQTLIYLIGHILIITFYIYTLYFYLKSENNWFINEGGGICKVSPFLFIFLSGLIKVLYLIQFNKFVTTIYDYNHYFSYALVFKVMIIVLLILYVYTLLFWIKVESLFPFVPYAYFILIIWIPLTFISPIIYMFLNSINLLVSGCISSLILINWSTITICTLIGHVIVIKVLKRYFWKYIEWEDKWFISQDGYSEQTILRISPIVFLTLCSWLKLLYLTEFNYFIYTIYFYNLSILILIKILILVALSISSFSYIKFLASRGMVFMGIWPYFFIAVAYWTPMVILSPGITFITIKVINYSAYFSNYIPHLIKLILFYLFKFSFFIADYIVYEKNLLWYYYQTDFFYKLFPNIYISIGAVLPILIVINLVWLFIVSYKQDSRLIYTLTTYSMFLSLQLIFVILSYNDFRGLLTFQLIEINKLDKLVISISLDAIQLNINFGYDIISLIFTILTVILSFIALVIGVNSLSFGGIKFYTSLVLFIELMLFIAFYTTDLFIFYIAFEGLTIPTFFLIYIYGAEITKLRAAKFFLVYSFMSSTFLSLAIILFYTQYQTTDITQLVNKIIVSSDFNVLTFERYKLIYLLLLLGFGIKIPLVPFHMWLPEAHAEASTGGSIILAGLILKLGSYGIFRFLLPIFGEFTFFNPYIYTTCLISIAYSLLACFRTTNIKQVIAYSSIIHMSVITIGLFSGQTLSITGSVFSMISHSFVSSGLFICAGILYNRFGSYEIQTFGGLSQTMPLFALCFSLLLFSNASLPLTMPFIGELLILLSLCKTNIYLFVFVILLMGFNVIYLLWLFNRILFGDINLNNSTQQLNNHLDITSEEFIILFFLIFILILLGVTPNLLLSLLNLTI